MCPAVWSSAGLTWGQSVEKSYINRVMAHLTATDYGQLGCQKILWKHSNDSFTEDPRCSQSQHTSTHMGESVSELVSV